MAPPQVVRWIGEAYPKPRVDDEWLNACCAWIADELQLNPDTQTDEFISNVETQLLESDLRDSMVEGTGLPRNTATLNNVRIRGKPVLVEVTAITEIGHSAFNLHNVRQTRLERADLAGLAADEGVENDEGPIPNYPRTMLRLEVSDGTVTLPAIEYRSIPEFRLAETSLGYKIMLKDVLVRRGIIFLEPKDIILKGHRTEDREVRQDADFVRSLCRRLGRPDPPVEVEGENDPPAPPLPPPPGPPAAPQGPAAEPPAQVRSPLRQISEPPERQPDAMDFDDDADLPRKRRIPNPSIPSSTATLVNSRFFAGSVSSTGPPSTTAMRTQASSSGSSSQQLARVLSPTRGDPLEVIDIEDSSTEVLDEPPVRIVQRSTVAAGKQPARAPVMMTQDDDVPQDSEYDFGSDGDLDAAFLDEIEKVEKAALESAAQTQTQTRTQGQTQTRQRTPVPPASVPASRSRAQSQQRTQAPKLTTQDVITIDDDDEDDKENIPVPIRRVRRRVSEIPDDVIDLSD